MKCRQFIQSAAEFSREADEFVRGPTIKGHPLRQVSKHVWMLFSPEGFPTSARHRRLAESPLLSF